jgi:hypothetical protein
MHARVQREWFHGGRSCLVSALPDPSCWRRAHTFRSRYKRLAEEEGRGRKLHFSVHEFAPRLLRCGRGDSRVSVACSLIRLCVAVCVWTLSVQFIFLSNSLFCVYEEIWDLVQYPFISYQRMSAIDLRHLVWKRGTSPLKKNFVKNERQFNFFFG